MTKDNIINYLKSKKDLFNKQGIINLGLYGSYARDEATSKSDIDIFYETNENFSMGLFAFSKFLDKLKSDLKVDNIDFVNLKSMNPIVKHYAKKDFIYV
jgi:predicted nucleotidyltransferase